MNGPNRPGPANCDVPHARTRAETCLEAGGKISHPTPTAWLCSSPGHSRRALRGEPIPKWPTNSTVQIWARNLSNGDLAVAVYNNAADASAYDMRWKQLPGVAHVPKSCRDLWAKAAHAVGEGLSGQLRGWQCLLYRCSM